MKDYVYYLSVNGEIQPEWVFGEEQEAIDFAEKEAIKDYEVIEWDVD